MQVTNTICLWKMTDTDFDIGALRLHKFTDYFAELVGVGQLPGSCSLWEGWVRARWGGHALQGIHIMETATESSDLLRTLQTNRRETKRQAGKGFKYNPDLKTRKEISAGQPISTLNVIVRAPPSTYYWCAQTHDCAERGSLDEGRGSSKKKKSVCTNLVYFQSIITVTFWPHPLLLTSPGAFFLLMDQRCDDPTLSQNQNILTTLCVHTSMGCHGDRPWCALDYYFGQK